MGALGRIGVILVLEPIPESNKAIDSDSHHCAAQDTESKDSKCPGEKVGSSDSGVTVGSVQRDKEREEDDEDTNADNG